MRKIYFLLLTVLFAATSNAQNIANYAFTPISGSYTALIGGINVPSIQADDATSPAIPIGFTFYYMGVPYTSVAANSNGWLSFNASPTTNTVDMRTNNFTTAVAGLHPLLAPVWDDLDGRTSVVPNPVASYLTTGAPGSRIFTFEWLNWAPFGATVPNVSFQVKLYEATSVIEFYYRQDGAATYSSASCGISNSPTSFASLSNLGAAPTVSNVTSTNTITALPATGQVYTFTPPSGVIASPTTLSFTSVGRTSLTVNWVDNSTNETFFTISRATAPGGPYTLAGSVPSTTTAGTGTGYNFISTGLSPGTTYYYRITASVEGSASPDLSGSQATNPASPFSGAYTINPDAPNSGTNFTTWTEAFTILNSQGLTGPTTFTVTGTGATITFAEGNLLLGGPYISGVPQSALLTTLNSTNTLSFVAGPGKTINMSGIGVSTTIDYVFRLMGVDYVTFDGINIIDVGATVTTQFEFGYVIGNAANSDGANNNTIRNFAATLLLANTGQANGPYGVMVQNGTALVAALGTAGTYASRNNNNKIQNFTINGAKRGVSFSGLAIPAYDDGNEVSGPVFTSAAGGTWVGGSRVTNGGGATSGTDWGVSIDGQKNMKVFNVQIDNFTETSASPALSGIHFGTAASTATGSEDAQVYNCVIHNLQNNLSLTSGVVGIRASGATKHTLKIYNNAIYDLRATIATGANVIVGALLTATGTGTKFELYNNSINLPGALAAAGISKGFAFGLATAVITAKNNAINFGTTGGGSTGGVIALDFGATTPTLLDFSSNIYNVGTTSAARRVAVYTSLNRSALIDWQSTMAITNGSSAGVDQRAGYGDPGFVSGTDLTYGAANSVENSGVPISGLATANDILGVARNAATPDLGIFEGNFSAGFVDVAAPGVVIDDFNRGTQAAEIRITVSDNVNTVGNITARLWYRLGVAGAFTALPPDVAPAGNNNGEYRWGTSIRALPVGTYQYYIIVKDAANNYFANPTMAPGAVSPGFASAPDPNWAGANPFASAGTNTFQVNGTPLAGGTYNVGATETYATLTAVAAELSTRPISGNVIFELTNNYSGAGETFPIVFNQPSYTVAGPLTITIRPAAGVVTERVTAGDPGASNALIVLDGMRDLTLDGRPGGVGSTRMWRFTNTRDGVGTLIGPAFALQNDALRNTLKYLTLQSNSNTGNAGVINILSTYFGGKGNSLNTIDNCDIGPNTAGTLVVPPNPVRGIAAVGGGTNSYNNGNTYSNNNIHDFHNTASNPVGIFVAGETSVTITGNSFYQTAARAGWAAFGLGIAVNGATGPGINISNNFIGGSAPLCAGGPMTISATTAVFYGIQVNTGLYTSASTINNNTFTNMNLTSANTAAGSVIVCGINPATNSNQYPINITNNTIGSTTVDATTSPAIILTTTSTALPSNFSGVFGSVTGGVLNLSNNNIGGVRLVATGTGTTAFIGIQHQTAGVAATIDNNLIGSLATANNIVQNSNATVTGIVNTSTLSLSNALITNNTVANITYNAAVAGTSQTFTGISGAGTAPLTINGNTIRDIVGNNHGSLTGISMASSGLGTTINNNTIRNWTINPQTASTSMTVMAMQINSGTSVGTVYKNNIYSLINGSTSTGSFLRGIQNFFGANWTYANNMISLGTGSTGDIGIRGIDDFSDAPATGFGNWYYNSVYISGAVAAGSTNTYAFFRTTSSTPETFRNNIFANARTGGTGFHVAMCNSSSATGWPATASDYNDLYSSNPATIAQWLGTAAGNNRTLAGWQASQGAGTPGSGGDANSKSALPVFISATDLHLSNAAGANWCLNGSGIVIPTITTDIDGQVRSVGVAPLGPDMGADEFVATATVDIATPASQTICTGTAITTIVLSGGAASYSWTRDNTVAATGIAASGTGNISGTLTNTTASPVTVTFTITPLSAEGCPTSLSTFTAMVTVNSTVTGGTVATDQTICSGGDPAAFTETVASTGGGTLTYQWQSSTTDCATGFSDIGGATGTTYDAPAGVTVTTYYRRVTTSTLNSVPCTANSNCITITVNDVTGGTVAADQTICSGGDPAVFTETVPSTGNGTLTYQWQSSTTSCAAGFSDIAGATGTTYDAPAGVTVTTYYRRVTTSTLNSVACAANSNCVTVFVNDVTGGTVAADQAICSGGDPAAFTQTVASTGSGTLTYQWQSSTTDCTTGFSDIAGATSATYDAPSGLTVTTYYRRVTTSTLNSVACAANSNCVTVTVNPLPSISGEVGQPSTCVSSDGTIDITVFGTPGPYTYFWTTVGGSGIVQGVQDQFTLSVGQYTLVVTDVPTGCQQTAVFNLTGPGGCDICPTIGSVTTSPSPAVCAGATVTLTASGLTSMGVTYGITFKYSLVALPDPYTGGTVIGTVANGSLTAGGTVATLNTSFPVSGNYIIYAILDPTPTDPLCRPSASVSLTVNPIPDAVATPSSQTICSAGSITTIVLSGAVGGTTFNWTRDNTVTVTGIAASGSGNISGTLTNTTNAPITVTFTITPTASGCVGTPITATVLVNPTPNAVATPSSQTICSGATITTIVLTGAVSGTTFNWTRDNTVAVTGIAASGSGNISGALSNTTAAPVTVTFTITPTANGCPGAPITATVLVNPTPDAVATPTSQIICSATPITTIVLSGAVSGTTYAWTRDNLVNLTGIAASGSGNISGTLTNTTNVVQTTTFTIIPTANGCPGAPITATVTVNPTPTVSPVPPNQTVCNGAPTAPVTFSGPVAGTTFNWVNNTPSIGLAASGTGNIASFNGINLTNAPVTATITVTPVTTPTGTVNFNFTGAVQTWVVPSGVTSISIQAFGAQGNANAAGVSQGGLGGSANGTLAVTPGETLFINVGGGGITSITGEFNGGGNGGTTGTCLTAPGGGGGGASDIRQIANTLANRRIVAGGGGGTAGNRVAACARGAGGGGGGGFFGGGGGSGYPGIAGVVPTGGTQAAGGVGGITGTTFGATNGLPGASGIGGAGGNEIASAQAGSQAIIFGSGTGGGLTGGPGQQSGLNNFTGQSGAGGSSFIGGVTSGSTTAGVRSGSGLVTISYATAGPSCTGPSSSFTITVNPTPNAVAAPPTQTICSGTAMTPIVLSGNVSGTVFNWTRNNIVNVTGIPNSGSGNISGTPINNTTVQQTVIYTITPVANGCTGPSITATLIVDKAPTITCPANITVNNTPGQCGANVTYPPATATGSPAPVITYSQASGTFFPVGTTTVTATATNICGVATCTFTITVLDVQAPTITCPAPITVNTDVGVCTATIPVPNPTIADNCAVTQLTWVMTGATTGSSPATGINFVGTQTFNLNGTTGQGITTITYTVRDAAGNTTTCSFTVTVNDIWIPVIGGQPSNQTVCVGTNAVFTVTASVPAGNPLTYKWQTWNGSAWVDISPAQTAATLTLNAVTFSMNTNSYRCILTGRCSVVTSGFATLYVNPLPTISILASGPLALLPAQSVTLTAVVSPGGGSYQWKKNGSNYTGPGATSSSLNGLTVDDIGSYTCTYTDLNGCVATSAAMVVSGQTSDNLYVYPNPNDGHFHVRFYNLINEEVTVSVYDAIGQLIYRRKVITSPTPYTDIEVDLGGRNAAGTYVVVLNNASGRQVGAKKIIVYDP